MHRQGVHARYHFPPPSFHCYAMVVEIFTNTCTAGCIQRPPRSCRQTGRESPKRRKQGQTPPCCIFVSSKSTGQPKIMKKERMARRKGSKRRVGEIAWPVRCDDMTDNWTVRSRLQRIVDTRWMLTSTIFFFFFDLEDQCYPSIKCQCLQLCKSMS